jgi:hypothetical protein
MKRHDHIFTPPIKEKFIELLQKSSVVAGGRASCGGTVDPTWVFFTLFNEVIRKATSLGYKIKVQRIKCENAYATIKGGFWHENEYTLEK